MGMRSTTVKSQGRLECGHPKSNVSHLDIMLVLKHPGTKAVWRDPALVNTDTIRSKHVGEDPRSSCV